jgi:ABC-type branched-subunit amino acid transport system ATPase component
MFQSLTVIDTLSSACWEKKEKKEKKKKRDTMVACFPGLELDMPCWPCWVGFLCCVGAIKG